MYYMQSNAVLSPTYAALEKICSLKCFLVKMHSYPTSQRSKSELISKANDDLDKFGNMAKVDSADGILSTVDVRAAVIKG
jgi:hypothetical protein